MAKLLYYLKNPEIRLIFLCFDVIVKNKEDCVYENIVSLEIHGGYTV